MTSVNLPDPKFPMAWFASQTASGIFKDTFCSAAKRDAHASDIHMLCGTHGNTWRGAWHVAWHVVSTQQEPTKAQSLNCRGKIVLPIKEHVDKDVTPKPHQTLPTESHQLGL